MQNKKLKGILDKLETKAKSTPKRIGKRGVSTRITGESNRTSPIFLDIYTADHEDVLSGDKGIDDQLVVSIKTDLNNSGLSREDIAIIAAGLDEPIDESSLYNMWYGLRTRSTMTVGSALKWMQILGRELIIITQNMENGWFDKLLELREAVERSAPKEELRELAKESNAD
jgi:hypothetical protein